MTPDQQHHIRNGIISIRRPCRILLKACENLSGNQRLMLEEMVRQAERVERACNGDIGMRNRRSWMTKTGAVLVAVGSITASCAEVAPLPAVAKWMNFAAILSGGVGAALMGTGIRRRLPATEQGGK